MKLSRLPVERGKRGTGEKGVEFRSFFFHLFVVMKSDATSKQNRCTGRLATYHVQGYRATKHFKDNTDRNRFLEKLGSVLQKVSTPCYGWALIPKPSSFNFCERVDVKSP